MSSVNSNSYISPIKLKSSNDIDYPAATSGQRGKPFSGHPQPSSSGHQPPPPPCDQHSYYGAPSALASMDHMASSLLQQQQQQQPLHSLLAQLHPTSYKSYNDSPDHYYTYHQRSQPCGKPSFVELKSMLRQRRAQYPADAFTCGYCQMHVESGSSGGGDPNVEGEGVSYVRCFGCGMPVHHFCILRYRSSTNNGPTNCSRTPNNQRLCYPWVCTECKSCWICGNGSNEVSSRLSSIR